MSSEFDFDENIFSKQINALKSILSSLENFKNSDEFYEKEDLPNFYKFSKSEEEAQKFLIDVDNLKEYSDYSSFRENYLKSHAPQL